MSRSVEHNIYIYIPKIGSCMYGNLKYDKCGVLITGGKRRTKVGLRFIISNVIMVGPSLTPFIKISSR